MSIQPRQKSTTVQLASGSDSPVCCLVAEALAGDCRLGFIERIRLVERDCGFGQTCSRGCVERTSAGVGFAGAHQALLGQVGPIVGAGNEGTIDEPERCMGSGGLAREC